MFEGEREDQQPVTYPVFRVHILIYPSFRFIVSIDGKKNNRQPWFAHHQSA